MAELFLAKQSGLEGFEKVVVIKRILRNLAEDDEFVTMFLDEARIAAKLSHPNIVQIYDLGKADETHYIAMEYVSGRNVQHLMVKQAEAGGFVPIEHACRIVAGVCEGLNYAHSRKDFDGKPLNIVHRDISPQNILVSFAGGVKVVDFGIAKASTQLAITRKNVLKGKYAYMSPEQVRGKSIDHRSDLFALGLVFYELLTGRRAFEREDSLHTLKAIVQEKPVNPRELNPDIPPEVVSLLSRALAKNPDRRYATAQDFQLAIEDYLESSPRKSNTVRLSRYMNGLFADELNNGSNTMVVQGLGPIIIPTNVEASDGPGSSSSDEVDEHTLSSMLAPENDSAVEETIVPSSLDDGNLGSDFITAAEATMARTNPGDKHENDDLSSVDATIPVQALRLPADAPQGAGYDDDLDASDMETRATSSLASLGSIDSQERTIGEVPAHRVGEGRTGIVPVELTSPGLGSQLSTDAGNASDSVRSDLLASEDSLAVRLLAKVEEMAQDVDSPTQAETRKPNAPSVSRRESAPSPYTGRDTPLAEASAKEPFEQNAGIRPAMASAGIRSAATPGTLPVLARVQVRDRSTPENGAYDEPVNAAGVAGSQPTVAATGAHATSIQSSARLLWTGVVGCLVVISLCLVFLWGDLTGPSSSEVSLLQTRFVKFDSPSANATATVGNKTKPLPATFVVGVGQKVQVTLRQGEASKEFVFEFPAGAEMLEQNLVLDEAPANAAQSPPAAAPGTAPTPPPTRRDATQPR